MGSCIVRFWELANKVAPFAKMKQQLLGHMASLEWFIPKDKGRARMPLFIGS